jgi:hypothetical protein
MQILELILFTLAGIWQGIRQDFNLLEIALLGVMVVWGAPRLLFMGRAERFLAKLSRRKALACFASALLAIGIRVALLPILHVPHPGITDEFSHLLLADTLLAGRVANPTHPFWVHFESIHIIQRPHYVSNYFPGQALVLAAAIWATGQPWIGILALSGTFCGVLCWCLQSWMPPRWALFGALLALLRFSIGSYWINALHGGFLPAIGGALVVGAFARLSRVLTKPVRQAEDRPGGLSHREEAATCTSCGGIVLGLGLAILAVTRPLEGALFSLPFVLALPFWRWRILTPLAVILALTLGSLALYFRQITGSPFATTYSISQKEYGWPMGLAWVKPRPIQHRHVEMERYYRYEIDENGKVDSPLHFLQFLTFRVQEYWRFYLGPALSVPLAMLPFVWRRRRLRIVFIGFFAAFGAVMLEGASSPHYLAPATAAIILLVVECFRQLRLKPRGLALARALPLMLVLVLTLRLGAEALHLPYTQALNYQSWCCKVRVDDSKDRIKEYLEAQPGRHLVFVRPKSDEMNLFQWIYNRADIDSAKIVWARDMGDVENARLERYFEGRKVWMVDPNVQPATITDRLGPPRDVDPPPAPGSTAALPLTKPVGSGFRPAGAVDPRSPDPR